MLHRLAEDERFAYLSKRRPGRSRDWKSLYAAFRQAVEESPMTAADGDLVIDGSAPKKRKKRGAEEGPRPAKQEHHIKNFFMDEVTP